MKILGAFLFVYGHNFARDMTSSLYSECLDFFKTAQSIDIQTSLVDKIKSTVGKSVMGVASQFLNNKAVSSIPIRINFARPKAEFVIDATGADAASVNSELKSILDQKFSGKVSQIITSLDKSTPSFNFGLFTVE